MSYEREQQQTTATSALGFIIPAIVILGFFLIPPVKQWLNRVPYLWEVLYPALTLFAIYGVYQARKDGLLALKWVLLVIAAASSTLAVYGAGGMFFTIGKVGAIAFIVIEIAYTLWESLR